MRCSKRRDIKRYTNTITGNEMLKTERNKVIDQYITGNEMLKTERYKEIDQYITGN